MTVEWDGRPRMASRCPAPTGGAWTTATPTASCGRRPDRRVRGATSSTRRAGSSSVTDADGVVELVNTYDAQGRVLTSARRSGGW